MQTLSFSGSTEKTFRIYSLSALQTVLGQCDARVESLSFSLDESTWAASSSSAFMDASSDLDCRDGSISLVIDPSKFNFDPNLAEGASSTRTIWIRGTTPYGAAASAKVHVTYVKDTVSPVIGSLATSKGIDLNVADGSIADITGSCTTGDSAISIVAEDGSGQVVSATAIPCVGGSFVAAGFSFASLNDGVITITATQTDEAGNAPATGTLSIAKDLVAPVLSITTPGADGAVVDDTNRAAFVVGGACSNGDPDISLQYDGVGIGTTSCGTSGWSTSLNLNGKAAGSAVITAIQTDALGNSTTTARQVTVTLSFPTLTVNSLAAHIIKDAGTASVTITGTCSDEGQNVEVTAPAGVTGSVVCPSGGNYTIIANFSAVADTNSPIPVSVSHTRVGGGTQTASTTILKKDMAVPTAPSSVTLAKATHNASNATPQITYSGHSDATSGIKNVYGRVVDVSSGTVIQAFTVLGVSPATLMSSTPFVHGETYRIELKVEDNVGHYSSVAGNQPTWRYDNVAPALTFAGRSSGQSVGTSAFNPDFYLTGTCETGLSLTITGTGIGGSATTSCSASSWNYSIPVTSFGADGPISYQISQTDAAGNTGTQTLSLILDRTAPVVTINPPSGSTFINPGNMSAFTVSGTCSTSDGVVQIYLGASLLAADTCVAGAFSEAVNLTSASEGSVNIRAEQYDSAANLGTDTETFIKDTIAPAAPASITLGTAYSNDTAQSPTINYSVISDPNGISKVEYKILNVTSGYTALGDWATAPTTGGKVPGTFVNGNTYRLQLRATDVPGNVSVAFAQQPTWTVDTTNPIVSITNYSDEATIGLADISSGLTISGTCEAGLNVEYWGTGFYGPVTPGSTICDPAGTFSYIVPSNKFPFDARYTFFARQIDLTELNSSTVSVDLNLDKTAPVIAIDTPTPTTYIGHADFNIEGTCSSSDLQVEVKQNGSSLGTVACTAGRFSKLITSSSLLEGVNNFEARQSDLAGNTGSAPLALTKDTTAPTVVNTRLVNNYSSSTSASAALTYDSFDDGPAGSGFKRIETQIKDSTASVIVVWGEHINLQTRPGTFVHGEEYSVEARYVDNANNVSAPTAVGSFRVDTIAPIIDFAFVDHETTDLSERITPTIQVEWTEADSGVYKLIYSIRNGVTNELIASNQTVESAVELFNSGRTLGPFGAGAPFNLTDSFQVTIQVEDRAGNQSAPKIESWEACPPYPSSFTRPESEHPSIEGTGSITIPARCAGKAVLITAIGEAGRQGDGNLISAKGIGSGAFASGIFSGAELAGQTLNIKFGGAGPAGHGDISNAARWGGRYAAVVGLKKDGTSRFAVIAGGGGGMGANMDGLPSGSAVNLPGLGGDRGRGQGRCNPIGAANDRAICGVNGNMSGTGSAGPTGVTASGGAKGQDVGSCEGFSLASDGLNATLDLSLTEGSGGRGLEVAGFTTRVGGGGGGGFGGGGGGGSYKDSGNCYGGSGGGGGSIVYGHIPGTVEAIVAGASQGEAYVSVNYGVAMPSVQCSPNFIYIPQLRGPYGDYNVNATEPGNGFCISKYEISGTLDEPKSVPSQEPLTNMSQTQAQTACSKFGDFFKLASNEQWQSVAQIAHWNHLNWQVGDVGRSRMNVGLVSNTKNGSGSFAAGDENVNPCIGTNSTCSKAIWHLSRRTHALGVATNAPHIWDMGGSMKELVEGQNTYGGGSAISSQSVLQLTGALTYLSAFGYYFPTARYNYGEHSLTSPYLNLGQISLAADSNSIFTRGSSHAHTTSQAGIFTIVTTNPAGELDRGFRCVKEPRW